MWSGWRRGGPDALERFAAGEVRVGLVVASLPQRGPDRSIDAQAGHAVGVLRHEPEQRRSHDGRIGQAALHGLIDALRDHTGQLGAVRQKRIHRYARAGEVYAQMIVSESSAVFDEPSAPRQKSGMGSTRHRCQVDQTCRQMVAQRGD